jgi:hypothetical protein
MVDQVAEALGVAGLSVMVHQDREATAGAIHQHHNLYPLAAAVQEELEAMQQLLLQRVVPHQLHQLAVRQLLMLAVVVAVRL